jgi:hypothetical protein
MGQAQSGPILQAQMISPRYRNAICPTMDDPEVIKIRVRIELSQNEMDRSSIHVVLSRNGNTLKIWQIAGISENDVLELPVSDVPSEYTRSGPYVIDDNPYEFTLELKKEGKLLDTATPELNKYPPPPEGVNEVRIDDDNYLINGEKKFIYGTYLTSYDTSWFSYLEGLGFEVFMENGARLTGGYHSEASWGVIRTDSGGVGDLEAARNNIKTYRTHPQLLTKIHRATCPCSRSSALPERGHQSGRLRG